MLRQQIRSELLAVLGVGVLLGGCSSLGPFFGSEESSGSPAGNRAPGNGTGTALSAGGLAFYLDHLQQLVNGDPLDQAAAFNEARDAADLAPTTRNRLRYALALSVPGHAGSDPEMAAARLADVIAASEFLTREERILAEIQLEAANALRILLETGRNTEQELRNASLAQDAEYASRLSSLEAENESLRTELQNVQMMLDAITNIEQSLGEREETDE